MLEETLVKKVLLNVTKKILHSRMLGGRLMDE
jgi:hypothetical protein